MELVIWAKPRGSTSGLDEKIMATNCRTQADINKVTAAASADGWHSFRVQTIDGRIPDFVGCLTTRKA
jgi:hypothetical protein